MKDLPRLVLKVFSAHPVWLAFFFSLLLSWLAYMGAATIGKDSAFYLDIAKQISEQGLSVATERFNWPSFMVLLAFLHTLTGFSFETLGYLSCGLFMAGTSALLVASVRDVKADLAPWACLAVLSIPAFNGFREDILREYGFWFFSTLALWLGLVWQRRGGFWLSLAIHASIMGAVSFRLEALILWCAFGLYLFAGLAKGRWRPCLSFYGQAVVFLAAGLLLFISLFNDYSRISHYVSLINPAFWMAAYLDMASELGRAFFAKYLDDEMPIILGLLLVLIVVLFFLKGCGLWLVALCYKPSWQALGFYWQHFKVPAIAAVLYALVLLVFLLQMGFINTRYSSFLHILLLPFLAYALAIFCRHFSRLGKLLIALLVLLAISNVMSFGAKKTHYVEAGRWVEQHIAKDTKVFFQDARIGYYAERGYYVSPFTLEQALSEALRGEYRYFALEMNADDPWLLDWLKARDYQVLSTFANRKGKTVVVVGPVLQP